METLADDLFVVPGPERVAGIRIGTRMTVIRLPGERLFLHSPVLYGPAVAEALARVGSPSFLVAPNLHHYLWLGAWANAFPEATVYGAPGLRKKRRELLVHRELEETPPPDWADVLDQEWVQGMPWVNEVAFLHRPSRSLLLTDLAFHYPTPPPGWLTRLWFHAMGLEGGLRASRLVRSLVRDRTALRASLERILAWDFERVIVTHGAIGEDLGPAALREAWRPLLAA